MTAESLCIDAERLLRRLTDLAVIGATEEGGCSRLALSDEDAAGRTLVCRWKRQLGLQVPVDGIRNIFGLRAGTGDLPPVMTGSHSTRCAEAAAMTATTVCSRGWRSCRS